MKAKFQKLSNHVVDNLIKEVTNKQFQSHNPKLEKLVSNNDFLVMDENLTNKDMEGMKILQIVKSSLF